MSLASFISIPNLLYNFLGVFIGIVFGAIPGLTATLGVALFLPFTFGMDPIASFALLLGIYCGGIYGGSITAILLKTPGTPSSAATVLDGNPMRNNGRAMEALSIATIGSFIGGEISCIALFFIAPQLAKVALSFGPPEYFAIGLFGLSIIAILSSGNLLRGIISGCVGLLIATIGMDPVTGTLRFTFGIPSLMGGFNFVAALIGLFAISEVMRKLEKESHEKKTDREVASLTGKIVSIKVILKNWFNIIRSSVIGTVIGIIPATGSAVASWLSYNEARRASKHPEKFGTGIPEGVFATEVANNAVTGGALIPLLTLGIPGDAVTAILMGALMLQGLTPGPLLFTNYGDVMKGLYIMLVVANLFMFLQGMFGIKLFVNLIKVPTNLLMSSVLILCFIGSFAINNNIMDVRMALFMGVLGYFMNKGDFPVPPVLLGIILEPIIEKNFRRSLAISMGDYSIFWTHPICLVFILISVGTVLWQVIKSIKKKKRPVDEK